MLQRPPPVMSSFFPTVAFFSSNKTDLPRSAALPAAYQNDVVLLFSRRHDEYIARHLIFVLRRVIVGNMNLPSKTFQRHGKWIEKPFLTHVPVCACGNKYIKTRPNQTQCIKCIYKADQR